MFTKKIYKQRNNSNKIVIQIFLDGLPVLKKTSDKVCARKKKSVHLISVITSKLRIQTKVIFKGDFRELIHISISCPCSEQIDNESGVRERSTGVFLNSEVILDLQKSC